MGVPLALCGLQRRQPPRADFGRFRLWLATSDAHPEQEPQGPEQDDNQHHEGDQVGKDTDGFIHNGPLAAEHERIDPIADTAADRAEPAEAAVGGPQRIHGAIDPGAETVFHSNESAIRASRCASPSRADGGSLQRAV